MGVYINMETPTVRDTLVLVKTDGTAIVYEDEAYVTTAVPVPPHGRLVDADVLFDRMEFEIKHFVPTDEFSRGVLSGYRSAARASRYASTIIPASEEGE